MPIPTTAATRTATFSGLGMTRTTSLSVTAATNAKSDLRLVYTPPTITSAATASAGLPFTVNFTSTEGAALYGWARSSLSTAAGFNCDSTANMTVVRNGTYAIIDTGVKFEGTGACHLIHATNTPINQIVELNPLYFAGTTASLTFRSRLRTAGTSEIAKVQLQQAGSLVWEDLYTQAGTGGGAGETAFALRTINLGSYANKSFKIRFNYVFTQGTYYPTENASVGWFFDAIAFTNVEPLSGTVMDTAATTARTFSPTLGRFLQTVSPVISGRNFPQAVQILTVNAAQPGYGTWAAAEEIRTGLAAGTLVSNPIGDQDRDGRVNLLEYAFGLSPTVQDSSSRPPALLTSATHLVVRYQKDTALAGISWTPQASANLSTWYSVGQAGAPTGFADTLISTAGTVQTREMRVPKTSGSRNAVRIRVATN